MSDRRSPAAPPLQVFTSFEDGVAAATRRGGLLAASKHEPPRHRPIDRAVLTASPNGGLIAVTADDAPRRIVRNDLVLSKWHGFLLDTLVVDVTREKVQVPVSPREEVTDRLLFEAPDDPARKLYLPRYELARREGEPGKYRLHLEREDGGGARLVLHLLKTRPAETGTGAAEELGHQLALRLERRQSAGGATVRTLPFSAPVEEEDGSVRAVLELATPQELDVVFVALTEPSLAARLRLVRSVRVAVPVPPAPAPASGRAPARPAAPRYRTVQRAVEQTVEPEPFVFPPALHGDAFRGVTGSGAEPGLVRRSVLWQGKTHNYYQDNLERDLFFYLPDRFQIARAPEPPYRPQLSVRFETASGSLDDTLAALTYVAVPVVSSRRIEEAAAELGRFLPRPGQGAPRFLPLQAGADAVRLRLALPGPATFQDRPGASIDLDESIVETLTLPLSAFQSVFDALFGGSTVLMSGEVVVHLGEGQDETVPFVGRLDELAGEIFDEREELDGETGTVRATLTNAIESPVEVRALAAELVRDGRRVPATVEKVGGGGDLLAPGAELSVVVTPTAPLSGTGPVDAAFDLASVRVLPDREAVWSLVLDPSTPAEYRRTITVRGFAALFEPLDERPDDRIVAVVVDFERGESVDLGPDRLSATAELRLPLADFVLRRVDEGSYRYRLSVIRLGGQQRDEEWRTDRTGILFPDVRR